MSKVVLPKDQIDKQLKDNPDSKSVTIIDYGWGMNGLYSHSLKYLNSLGKFPTSSSYCAHTLEFYWA